MPTNVIAKITHRGLQDIMTQRLNAGHSGYDGDVIKWQGDTAFSATLTRESTPLPSGNDPAWDFIEGPVLADIELTLYALPLSIMPELLSVEYDEDEGVCVGDSTNPVFLGLCLNQLVKTDGVSSKNKTIFNKVRFNLPEISAKTIEEGDNAVANVVLSGKAYPVFFSNSDGTQGNRTYSIVNSVDNAAKFVANESAILFPGEPIPETT